MLSATQLEIRRAGPEDISRAADVLLQSFAEFISLYTAASFAATTPCGAEVLERMREGPVWLASSVHKAVGTVAAVVRGESVYIRGMAVLPASRGSGAGTKLLQQVEEWAAGEGYSRLFLSTTPFLFSAIRLYEKFGFRRTDERFHDLLGTPLFTMEKFLSRL